MISLQFLKFIQFLAKNICTKLILSPPHPMGWKFHKYDISMQFWTFHLIPSKSFWEKLTPSSRDEGLEKMTYVKI